MRQRWIDQKRFIGAYPCVSLGQEDALIGERGDIWENLGGSPNRAYKAIIVVAAKSEKIIYFNINELERGVKKLKVPHHRSKQLKIANDPNRFK